LSIPSTFSVSSSGLTLSTTTVGAKKIVTIIGGTGTLTLT
jgi:hypothetical protein